MAESEQVKKLEQRKEINVPNSLSSALKRGKIENMRLYVFTYVLLKRRFLPSLAIFCPTCLKMLTSC